MTPELKAQLDALEDEFKGLDSKMAAARAEFDARTAEAAPIVAKAREAEAVMDEIKPRHRELAEKLSHLRKAVG
jgi:chromosome segregation ATPase